MERYQIHRTTEDDIGNIYGCYKVIGIAKDRVIPSGKIKKYYLCECIICGSKVEIQAYHVRNKNYKYCKNCKPNKLPIQSLVGEKFGRLTVIERADNHKQPSGTTKVVWKCLCDCGNIVNVQDHHLKTGHTISCGCYHAERMQELLIKDLTGMKTGKLTVLRKAYIKNGRQNWVCKCECGNECVVSSSVLTNKKRKSCGCLSSIAEYEFEQYLISKQINYQVQYKFEDCTDIRPLPFDFAILDKSGNLTMLVELNGEQHYYPFTFCGESKEVKIENLKDRQRKDKIKREYCKSNNIPLLEIRYTKFYKKNDIFDKFYKNIIGEAT